MSVLALGPPLASRVEATPLPGPLGALVEGIDLRDPGRADEKRLEELLEEHLVLFLRCQPLSDEEHTALAARFGRILPHPITRLRGETGAVTVVRNDAVRKPTNAAWHSDLSWLECPPGPAILRAVLIPEHGGDTLWSNMHAAWEGLPTHWKDRIRDLRAVHDFDRAVGPKLRRLDGNAGHQRLRAALPPAEHPIVRRHPSTGREALFVNESFTSHVVGVPKAESEEILASLFAHIDKPEWRIRHRWREGDVVIWDERVTQHHACDDHYPAAREVRRVTIVGERPT